MDETSSAVSRDAQSSELLPDKDFSLWVTVPLLIADVHPVIIITKRTKKNVVVLVFIDYHLLYFFFISDLWV